MVEKSEHSLPDDVADSELCRLAHSGCSEAEEALVVRYARLVRACARPYFLAGGESEDLIQEGCLGLLSAIRSFSEEKSPAFPAYAALCIRHRLISAVRQAAGDKHSPLNTYISLELSQIVGDQISDARLHSQRVLENPEDRMIREEHMHSIWHSLSQDLSTLELRILQLYLDGFSYSEIAERLQCASKAVDNAVQRIRRKAARQMQDGEYSES